MLGGFLLRSQIRESDEQLQELQSALVISRQKLAESCAQLFLLNPADFKDTVTEKYGVFAFFDAKFPGSLFIFFEIYIYC